MHRWLRPAIDGVVLTLLAVVFAASAVASAAASLDQRLADARAGLVTADAAAAAHPAEEAVAIERLFDLLDEADQLETDEAQALVDRDLALRRTDANGSVAYALALERSARWQRAHYRLADSISTAQSALAMLQRQSVSDEDADATIRATLGVSLTTLQRADEAVPPLQAAIAWFDAHHVVDLRLAVALRNLSFDYRLLNKLDLAQSTIDRAIAVATTLDGADSALLAEALTFEAFIPRARGNVAAAVDLLERALTILRDAQPKRRGPYARALLSLAQALNASGDGHAGEQRYREGIAVEEGHPSYGGMLLAGFYNGLGLYLVTEERSAEAIPNFERALALYRKLFGPDYRAVWYTENNLAIAYRYLGRLDESAALLRHVVEVTDRAPAGSDESATPARPNLATVYVWQERNVEAEQLFRSFLARIGPGHDFGEIDPRPSMEGLTASLWAQGRDDAAFAQALATERSRQKLIRTAGADLSERHALGMADYVRGGLDWAIAIAAKNQRPELTRAAWELALETRGIVSIISARRLAVARAASDPQLAQVWKQWKDRDEALVQARLNASRDPSQATAAALDVTEQTFDTAERALARAIGASGAPLDRAHAGLERVLAALPTETLLVSYVEGDSSQPRDLERTHAELPGRLYAFIARHGKAPQLIDLGPRPVVQVAVQHWLALVVDHAADAKERTDAGRRVRELIWDPISRRWPQRRVLLVSSALLDRVPFAALPETGGHYLVETGYAFHLLDHERDVLAPAAAPINASAHAPTLSLIGAPDFSVATGAAAAEQTAAGTRGVCSGLRGATFSPLPQAAREIDELHSVWTQRPAAAAPIVLTGVQANEASAREAMLHSSIVHFATHGMYLGKQCEDTGPDSRGLKTIDVQTQATPEGAQDLSALVLSGANRAATSTEDDGLLTSEEIAAIDMSGTDWAVLSACDSGVGKNISNEGVFGLRRAFRLAGVRSVVMSLWPVDDRASADWMVALYRARLQQHASTIDAVRAADLALIAQRRNAGLDPAPFYWAAFVAAGDWR